MSANFPNINMYDARPLLIHIFKSVLAEKIYNVWSIILIYVILLGNYSSTLALCDYQYNHKHLLDRNCFLLQIYNYATTNHTFSGSTKFFSSSRIIITVF